MRSAILCAGVLTLVALAGLGHSQNKKDPYAGHIAPTDPRSPADEKKTFRLPAGFEVQLVAAEPDIHKPLNMAFDDQGRLWVTETVEYPFPAGPGKEPRDAVKVLSDFGPDGRARKITTFAGGLNIPIGVLPLPGARPRDALVYSIPKIYRLRDDEGSGHADTRTVLYGTYGYRDTHGMTNSFTWGFDGWVYACHGFSNTSKVKGGKGRPIAMQSGNTYRIRPDGSRIEQFTHGQVNPFGLCFDPLGNLYSADCHSQPIYQLLRGTYYPSFGKPDDGLGFAPEMFVNYKGSTAIAGVVYYAADHFPKEYQGTAFIGDVVTNRINQFKIRWHGSSPWATQHDFLVSDDPWFRPVDTKLGPDGALYVADFYNRIIGHYEVPLTHPGRDRERGRIWRIVYTGKDHKGTPAPRKDWTRAGVNELVKDLAHPNITVRFLAANELVHRGGRKVAAAVRAGMGGNAWQRLHGLWVLERCGELKDDELAAAAKDPDRAVRVHAQRVLSERKELTPGAHKLAVAGLKDSDPNVRRAAADALGQHAAAENLRPLLDLRHAVGAEDTHLLHVVRMALRNQLLPDSTWDKLPLAEWTEKDARAVADVALGVPSAPAAAYLMDHIRHHAGPRDTLLREVHHIARHGSEEVGKKLLSFVRGHHPEDLGLQVALFHAIQRGTQERGAKLARPVEAWAEDLTGKLLASKNASEVKAGVELVGALKLASQQRLLAAMAADRARPDGQRVAALTALAAIDVRRYSPLLGKVLADARASLPLREQAANLLARANRVETQVELVAALASAPARLQNVIAVGLAGSRGGAEGLLDAVGAGKASARLLQERSVALRLAESKVPRLKERVAKLTAGLPPADQQLQDLLNRRRRGFLAAKRDPEAGKRVFEKNCAVCHQVGGQGAKIGPQLDGIGLRGLDRLLEDVLDPNRNVDQAFRLTTLELKKGQVVSGLLLREEGQVLVLADNQGKEVRVPKNEVEERAVSQMSPMPANFAEQIPEADFYNLLAYLLAQQGGKPPPGGR